MKSSRAALIAHAWMSFLSDIFKAQLPSYPPAQALPRHIQSQFAIQLRDHVLYIDGVQPKKYSSSTSLTPIPATGEFLSPVRHFAQHFAKIGSALQPRQSLS
jgi:hypothetical protein